MRTGGPELDGPELDDVPDLPPVPLPSAAELLDAARRSTALRRLTGFVEWVGDGRALAPDGELTAGDARAAATAVGMSPGRPEFTLLVRWARAAGLVRTLKGRLVPVRGRRTLLGRPIDLWEHLFLSFGAVGERYVDGDPRFAHPVWRHWPDLFELVNLSLYTAGGGTVPVEMLVEVTVDAPVGTFGFMPYANPVPAVRREWHAHLVDALAACESLGAVRTVTSTDAAVLRRIRELTGRADADPTLAALTPIGLWAMNRWLVAQGVPAPVVGELAGIPLTELFDRLAHAGPEIIDAELAGWVTHRGASRAAGAVEETVRAATEPGLRMWALAVLDAVGEHGRTAARRLRAVGGIPGSLATGWLLGVDAIEPTEEALGEARLGIVDQLSALAAEGFVEEAFEDLPVADQVRMVGELSGTDHPDLPAVLDAIADAPLDRKVAKAARAARSRLRKGKDRRFQDRPATGAPAGARRRSR